MFVLWSLVLWGTFLLLSALRIAAMEGLQVAIDRIQPRADDGVWGWINLLLMPFAVLVWCLAAAVSRRSNDR